MRSKLSKQIVPRRVAKYAPGLCEIGDNFVEYIRHKRDPDGYVEDVHSANIPRLMALMYDLYVNYRNWLHGVWRKVGYF